MEEINENASVDVTHYVDDAIKAGKGWTDEERKAYLASIDDSKHPFFAESIEDMDPDMVEAFRQIAYEDETPEESAERLRDKGNEFFKRTRMNKMYYRKAAESYSEGIKHAVMADNQTDEVIKLRAKLLANRAACNLNLNNFGMVKCDCEASLALVPGNLKCYYRKAKALFGLKKYVEAIAICEDGLRIDDTVSDLIKLVEECKEMNKLDCLRLKVAESDRNLLLDEAHKVYASCLNRGIALGPSLFSGSLNSCLQSHMPSRNPDDANEEGLLWPILLLYPQSGFSDFIETAFEDSLVAEHLANIFPEEGPPVSWDKEFGYKCSNLDVYVKTHISKPHENEEEFVAEFTKANILKRGMKDNIPRGTIEDQDDEDECQNFFRGGKQQRWIQVDVTCCILDVLKAPNVVIAGGVINLFIVPKKGSIYDDGVKRWLKGDEKKDIEIPVLRNGGKLTL
eukprot:365693_1